MGSRVLKSTLGNVSLGRRSTFISNLSSSLLSAFSSDQEVRPVDDVFPSHDCIRLVVSFMVVQVFVFR